MAGWWLAGLLGFDGFPPFRKGETWVLTLLSFGGWEGGTVGVEGGRYCTALYGGNPRV